MRLHEATTNEPGRIVELLDHGHSGGRDLSVGLVVVVAICRTPLAPVQGAIGDVTTVNHFATEWSRLKCLSGVPRAASVHPQRFLFGVRATAKVK